MKEISIAMTLFLVGCSQMVPIANDIEEIWDNDAITVKVDKDAFKEHTNVDVNISVQNKEPDPIIVTPFKQ